MHKKLKWNQNKIQLKLHCNSAWIGNYASLLTDSEDNDVFNSSDSVTSESVADFAFAHSGISNGIGLVLECFDVILGRVIAFDLFESLLLL